MPGALELICWMVTPSSLPRNKCHPLCCLSGEFRLEVNPTMLPTQGRSVSKTNRARSEAVAAGNPLTEAQETARAKGRCCCNCNIQNACVSALGAQATDGAKVHTGT